MFLGLFLFEFLKNFLIGKELWCDSFAMPDSNMDKKGFNALAYLPLCFFGQLRKHG
jgi:hypothetical protein